MRFHKFTFALLFSLCFGINVFAQEQGIRLEEIARYDKRLINCETYSADFDVMISAFAELIENSEFLILVARLGVGESNRGLNQRRLHNVRERLIAKGINAKKFVLAEGEKASGLGRVEIYAGGKLIEVFPVKRNKDICVECCGPDERFYPYKEIYERQPKQPMRRRH